MKLKTSLTYIAALSLFAACNSGSKSGSFQLTGTLTNGGEGISIYLDKLTTQGTVHLDSTKIKGGKFEFHTKGIVKGFYNLRITDADYATLILDSAEQANVNGDSQFLGNTYVVTGSEDSKLFCDVNTVMKRTEMKMDSIKKLYQALINTMGGDTVKMDSLSHAFEKPYDDLMTKQKAYVADFVKQHTNSFACLAYIQMLPFDDYSSTYSALDESLSKSYPNSAYVTMFHNDVANLKRVMVGSPAPDFTLPDPDGKDVSLSSFKGKVVLIDFWASWCAPCRASLPGVVRVYNKFKDKNFTVLSVSLDKDKDHWVDAIKKFDLTWTHCSDLKYWDSKVVKLYGFDGIPFSVLVDEKGNIVAKNLEEEALTKKLEGMLSKS
ncbi:MAG TPA: TlpA disulfide reductase family protein [Bacteroidia bacterium]|nr:TlpA disulfide reductase family protein [Bacteroidia bacterium]